MRVEKVGVNNMILYHVSKGWTELYKEFIPRVPEFRAYDEDNKTERICLSDSIGGCLSAIPDSLYHTDEYTKLTIYECDIDDYINYEELYKYGMVPDAYVTHEYWCLKPIWMFGTHVLLSDFDSHYEFVPDEKRLDEYVLYVVDYLNCHDIIIPADTKKRLENCTMIEAMYDIFPPLFYKNNLDLDDVSEEILTTSRIISNPKFSIVKDGKMIKAGIW